MKNVVRNQKGFTLIEIIAVLVILGILAAVAVPKFFDMQESAEMKSLQVAANDMNSRLITAFSQSMLNNDGVADTADYNAFDDLGLAAASDMTNAYKDFVGTWNAPSGATVTYTMKNGGTTYTFTISGGTTDSPGSIDMS